MAMTLQAPPVASEFASQEVEQFRQEGFAIVRGLAEPSLAERMRRSTRWGLEHLIEPLEYEADLKYPGAPLHYDDAGGRTVRRLKLAHARDAVFTEWIQQPGVVGRVRQILGPEIVCPLAHHNCIMTKQPRFSSQTGWHQDSRYWSYQQPDLVSVWLALGSERVENGCLRLIPGSHRLTYDRSQFNDELFFVPDNPQNQALIDRAIDAPLEAGDVLFFHSRTLHAAGKNHTHETKLSVVFTYRALGNAPLPGTRSSSLPEMLIPPTMRG